MRRSCTIIVLISTIVLHFSPLRADEFFIATGGSNGNSGTIGSPWGTFDFAIDQLDPGDTLWVRGGSYDLDSRIRLQSGDGGTSGNPVSIWSYQNEVPILDFDSMTGTWGSSSGRGIQIDDGVDWLHFKGLTIQNARDNGIGSQSDNSIFEQLTTRWNGDSGLQLDGSSSNNLVLNSDSYENYDPSNNGENADGFAIKFANLGPGNIVRGSRAWGNSDDGWDMWESTTGGVLVEDSWAFDNGKLIQQFFDKDALEDGDLSAGNFSGDGNGFKLGHDGGPHVLNRVLAWQNEVRGIDVNGNGFGVTVSNSTVYDSGRNWQFDETAAETMNQHVLRNNISYAGSSSDQFQSGVDDSFNTWNGIPVNGADFLSLDDTIARGDRMLDGSLPISDFLRLDPVSNLVDAGTDVGLPFNGSAPDLGAFEVTDADFDGDGDVDGADFLILQRGFGLDGQTDNSFGDANVDTFVDSSDLAIWESQFGMSIPFSAVASVPEPTTLLLLSCAAMTFAWWRNRRSLILRITIDANTEMLTDPLKGALNGSLPRQGIRMHRKKHILAKRQKTQ